MEGQYPQDRSVYGRPQAYPYRLNAQAMKMQQPVTGPLLPQALFPPQGIPPKSPGPERAISSQHFQSIQLRPPLAHQSSQSSQPLLPVGGFDSGKARLHAVEFPSRPGSFPLRQPSHAAPPTDPRGAAVATGSAGGGGAAGPSPLQFVSSAPLSTTTPRFSMPIPPAQQTGALARPFPHFPPSVPPSFSQQPDKSNLIPGLCRPLSQPQQLQQQQQQQQPSLMNPVFTSPQGVPRPLTPIATATLSSWLALSPHHQQALTAVTQRVEGAFEDRDYTYTEGSLRGLASVDMKDKLTSVLRGLTGSEPQHGIWSVECWRAVLDPELLAASTGCLSRQRTEFQGELWVKKYLQPAALRHFYCLRMYSAEHLVASSSFPLNTRRVKEAAVAPAFLKMLPALGFRKSATNSVHVTTLLFQMAAGSTEGGQGRLLILVQKHFKEVDMQEELFPGKLIIEVIGRIEDDTQLEPLSRRLLDVCRHLQPFVQFHKF